MAGKHGHVSEINYNTHLADLLGKRMPGWTTYPQSEKTVDKEKAGGALNPDLVAAASDQTPVVVEAKYGKTSNLHPLDVQTKNHVANREWERTGQTVSAAVSVVYPVDLAGMAGGERAALESEQSLRFASWTAGAGEPVRFPGEGYLTGGLDRLPARKASVDKTRKDLDRAVLADLLGYGEDVVERVDVIRDQWCREPHLTGKD